MLVALSTTTMSGWLWQIGRSAMMVRSHKILLNELILHNWLGVMFPPAPIDVKLVLVQEFPVKKLGNIIMSMLIYVDWAIKEQELVR